MLPRLNSLLYISLLVLLAALLFTLSAPKLYEHMSLRLAAFLRPPRLFQSFVPIRSNTSVNLSIRLQTTMTSPAPNNNNNEEKISHPAPPLPLPAPDDTASTSKLDLSTGKGSVTMDHLGPMVVNLDGTLSRIANWDEMSEIERGNTLRVLGKRNQLRLEGLRKAQAQAEGEEGTHQKGEEGNGKKGV